MPETRMLAPGNLAGLGLDGGAAVLLADYPRVPNRNTVPGGWCSFGKGFAMLPRIPRGR